MIWKALAWLQTNLIWSITAMILLGLTLGSNFDMSFLKPLVLPITFLMVYPMMINLQFKQVLACDNIKLQTTAQIINFLIIPFLAFGIGMLFLSDSPMVIMGLLIAALIPTSGMTISWTAFSKGNMNAAIKMTVIGLILGAILAPIYLKFFMGEVIHIPMQRIFTSIAVIVFLPIIFGYITRKLLIKNYGEETYSTKIKQKFPLISNLGVLCIIFIAMSLKAPYILSNPTVVLSYFIPLILFYLSITLLSTMVGKMFFSKEDSIALVYGTAMRNLAISLALAMTAFGDEGTDVAIILALAFVIQIKLAVWYSKFVDTIFKQKS